MNAKENELLDEIDAWRKAKISVVSGGIYVATTHDRMPGETHQFIRVQSGKFAREIAEPEMAEAVQAVIDAFKKLEPARVAIVERKLFELRLAGMTRPGATP